MKVLVTGGAGFIGRHLCRELVERGHRVLCMDNLSTSSLDDSVDEPWHEFWRHDVCDRWHVEVDRVYHLACPASPLQYKRNPVRTVKTAVLGTLNALELCRDTGASLLIASTSEVYGDPLVHPQSESYYGNVNPVGDRACYDEGKRAGEALAASWFRYGTGVRIARIFNTYGPGMASDDGRLMPNLALQALNGLPMTVFGDGSQTRSWCHVKDTVSGLISVMEHPLERLRNAPTWDERKRLVPVFNVGNPDERTVLQVAAAVRDWCRIHWRRDWDYPVSHLGLPMDDPVRRRPDICAIKELGWEPKVPFDAGLAETMSWFRRFADPETAP